MATSKGSGGGDQAGETTPAPTKVKKGRRKKEVGDGEDGFYVNRAQFIQAAQILMRYGRLLIVGPPASGKSYFAHALVQVCVFGEGEGFWRVGVGVSGGGGGGGGKTYFAHALVQFFQRKGYFPTFEMDMCRMCHRNMIAEDVGPKRVVLLDDAFDQLRGDSDTVRDYVTFFYNTQNVWHEREWNCLVIITLHPHIFADFLNMELGGKKEITHEQVVVHMTHDPRDLSRPFEPSVDTLLPFLYRHMRNQNNTNILSCLLGLSMQGFYYYTFDPKTSMAAIERLGYDGIIGCHELDRLTYNLKDVLYDRTEGGFINRAAYDACGLALGLYGAIATLLRSCDAKFLVDYVRWDEEASPSPRTLVVPADRPGLKGLLMDRIHHLLLDKREGRELSRHPSFRHPEAVAEFFQLCRGKEGFVRRLLTAVDAEFELPMLYWSLWAPAPDLTRGCLEVMAETVVKDRDLTPTVLTCLLACALLSPHAGRVRSFLAAFVKTLARLHYRQGPDTLNLALPVPSGSSADGEGRAWVEDVRGRALTGACYMNNPALAIPPSLLSLAQSDDSISLAVCRDQWYLTLRLLTDTEADEKDELDNTVLHVAAAGSREDTEVLRTIVRGGASLTARNKRGHTPCHGDDRRKRNREAQQRRPSGEDPASRQLLAAAGEGDLETVKVLLCQGANLQATDGAKNTPLHLACRGGHAAMAALLLQLRAKVDAHNSDRQTPLHVGCASGHLAAAKLLLDQGADVMAQDAQRASPLHLACSKGAAELAAVMIEHGANVQAEDKAGVTPLFLASQGGHRDAARVLLKAQAHADARNGADAMTALHVACLAAHAHLVALLLQHGADARLKDGRKRTPADIVRQMGFQDPVFEQLLHAPSSSSSSSTSPP
ncbi:uncharacterized protein LOC143280384 [Babylonia areolata]|uniref:uncharacterized protein LOC143280384 n=1 Tax=Babylonia areolata TaxID=304850 RepID=UPI003FD59D37